MIRAFDHAQRRLLPAATLPDHGWLDATAPDAAEVALLRERLGVPDELLQHALDEDEIARLQRDASGWTLVILRVPFAEPAGTAVPYRAVALGVLWRGGLRLTVSSRPTGVPDALPEAAESCGPLAFFLHLLYQSAARFLDHLRAIDQQVGALEEQLQHSQRNKEVRELLRFQKALVFFTTALRSNELMLERLRHDPEIAASPTDLDLLEDVLVELRQATQMTQVSADILSQMMDAFASIISNNLNVVMKALTSLTLVLALPSLVASFYGMNVKLPFQQHSWAFSGTLLVSLGLGIAVAWLFRRRRWL